jgi:hypothetical protein
VPQLPILNNNNNNKCISENDLPVFLLLIESIAANQIGSLTVPTGYGKILNSFEF